MVTLGPSPTGGGTTGKIYFNGVLQDGGTRDNIPVSIGDIGEGGTTANFIGNGSWNDPRPTEQVDDFRIYGYELSAADVLELFEGDANAAPVGVADSYTTTEGEALVVAAPGVLANDTDAEGDALTATGLTQPADGVVSLAADGSFTYMPDAGFVGHGHLHLHGQRRHVGLPPTTVTITVEEAAQHGAGRGGRRLRRRRRCSRSCSRRRACWPTTPTPTATPSPPRGSASRSTARWTCAADGSFTYTPDAGFTGKDQFTYRAERRHRHLRRRRR